MGGPVQGRAMRAVGLGVVGVIGIAAAAYGTGRSPTVSACVHHAGGGLYAARSCHSGDRRLTWSVTGPAGARGAIGPRGPGGPPGLTGLTGAKGDPGVVAAAQSGGADPPALGGPIGTSQTLSDFVLTTSTAGRAFAFGHVDVTADCPTAVPTVTCSFTVGLYIDGQPVPGSARGFDITAFSTGVEETAELFGIAASAPAGTHHVTIGYRTFIHSPSNLVVNAPTHAAVLVLGG